jgi:hypothetical protein
MKLDENYTYILVCSESGEQLPESWYLDNKVCPSCGTIDVYTAHQTIVAGKWNRPNLLERSIGKKAYFIRRED